MKLLPRNPAKSSTWGDWRSPEEPIQETSKPQPPTVNSLLNVLALLGTIAVASYFAGQLLGYALGLN